MQREPADSSVIASIGYDSENRELDIEYRARGDIYRYFEVPLEEYQALAAAESKGEYLNKVFKPRGYRYAIIRNGQERVS
jgi:KTSC domain